MGEIIRTLAVVGVGLVGGSVVLAARRRWPDVEVRAIDRADPLDAVRDADVVVLAAPVDRIVSILPRLPSLVAPGALVMDTGSVKRPILRAARLARLPHFVGGHPLAGGTATGADAARADLFDGRPWFLMAHGASRADLERASALVDALGARAVWFDDAGEQHDRLMAALSHLPQLVASTLMTAVGQAVGVESLEWAGAGLRDTTRLAGSPAGIWESVLAANQDELRPLLKTLAAKLDALADRLDDPAAIRDLFDRAVRLKASCL